MDEHDPRDIKWSNLLLWLQQRGMDISSEGLPVAYRHFSGFCAVVLIEQLISNIFILGRAREGISREQRCSVK